MSETRRTNAATMRAMMNRGSQPFFDQRLYEDMRGVVEDELAKKRGGDETTAKFVVEAEALVPGGLGEAEEFDPALHAHPALQQLLAELRQDEFQITYDVERGEGCPPKVFFTIAWG